MNDFSYLPSSDGITFEKPVLTKIRGEPTYESLKLLKKEIKRNAQSVPSDLGGGANGHLGLVIPPAEYALISDVPYIAPPHPGNLEYPNNATQFQIVTARRDHDIALHNYRTTVQMKQALISQLVAAIDSTYLKELRNAQTDTITMEIHEVLTFLFENYADIDTATLQRMEEKVQTYVWDIKDPPALLYDLIEDLQSMSSAAGVPKTEAQIVASALDVVRRTGSFDFALIEWYATPEGDRDWARFKIHFNRAHKELKKIRPTMETSQLQHANQIAQLTENLDSVKNVLMERMDALSLDFLDLLFQQLALVHLYFILVHQLPILVC